MQSQDGRFRYLALDRSELPDGTTAQQVHRVAYQCRATKGAWCDLNLRGRGHDLEKRSWSWNGDVNAPTIVPSVNCKGCWHGYIREGVFLKTNETPEEKQ